MTQPSQRISAHSLADQLAARAVTVIDVREPMEYAGGHIAGSLNVPLSRISQADLPQGALVAIASDPVNQGRGLRLLEKLGLVQLKPQAGLLAKLSDIAANPKQLKFKEVDGPHLAQATQDVDLAQGYPYFIIAAKAFDPSSALVLSHGESDRFAIHFVARADKVGQPDVKRFIAIYQQSPAVRAYIDARNLYR